MELDGPAEVDALQAEIERRRRDSRLPALEEVVSAARTILIEGLADPAAAFARDLSDWNVPPAPRRQGRPRRGTDELRWSRPRELGTPIAYNYS